MLIRILVNTDDVEKLLGAELLEALRNVPFFECVDSSFLSANQLIAKCPKGISYVEKGENFKKHSGDVNVLIGTSSIILFASCLTGKELLDVGKMRREAQREAEAKLEREAKNEYRIKILAALKIEREAGLERELRNQGKDGEATSKQRNVLLPLPGLTANSRKKEANFALRLTEKQKRSALLIKRFCDIYKTDNSKPDSLEGFASLRSENLGIVAPLAPREIGQRGLTLLSNDRKGVVKDPCVWPSVAVVKNTTLQFDRETGTPVNNKVSIAIRREVAIASDAALQSLIRAPDKTIAELWIGRDYLMNKNGEKRPFQNSALSCMSGRLWLTHLVQADVVQVRTPNGTVHYRYSSENLREVLPVGGEFLSSEIDTFVAKQTIRDLSSFVYRKLLRDLANADSVSPDSLYPDSVASHFAMALAFNNISAKEVNCVFSCFRPPLNAKSLEVLFRSDEKVVVIDKEDEYITVTPALVDDGSLLYRTILRILGRRVIGTPEGVAYKFIRGYFDSFTTPVVPVEKKGLVDEKTKSIHVLTPLTEALRERLYALGMYDCYSNVEIWEGSQPMVKMENNILLLAGNNPHLRALEAKRIDGAIHQAALDMLCAHVLTVLNKNRSRVTDSREWKELQKLLTLSLPK